MRAISLLLKGRPRTCMHPIGQNIVTWPDIAHMATHSCWARIKTVVFYWVDTLLAMTWFIRWGGAEQEMDSFPLLKQR